METLKFLIAADLLATGYCVHIQCDLNLGPVCHLFGPPERKQEAPLLCSQECPATDIEVLSWWPHNQAPEIV